MSREIVFEISVDGESLCYFNSLTINQQFGEHHKFELVLEQDVIEDPHNYLPEKSQHYIGKFISVCFGQTDAGDNIFKGIISEVGLIHKNGMWGSVVLRGYSPTCLMESGADYNSYENITLREILEVCSRNIAGNDMYIRNKPLVNKSFSYICQYNESDYSFIKRIASETGEWFFFDGNTLFLGRPERQETAELIYGRNISEMHFSMKMIPSRITSYSYNSQDDTFLSASLPEKVRGINEYAGKSLEAADKLFLGKVKEYSGMSVETMGDLDAYNRKYKEKIAANTVLLKAESDHPEVKLGHLVNVKVPAHDRGAIENDHGLYTVINLIHKLTGTGAYSNSFEAIPSTMEVIPVEISKPIAESQIAVVRENNDPEKFGRVRVQMLWQKEKNIQTGWLRIITPDAGSSSEVSKNRGFVFVPEVGDQVVINFEYGNPDRPYVAGSIFHGCNAEGGGKNNEIKSIKTRSGHILEFNDCNGSETITIKDKSDNLILLDTASSGITISAPENLLLKARNIDIIAEDNVSVSAGKDISLSAKSGIVAGSGEDIIVNAGKDYLLAAENINVSVAEKESHTADTMVFQAKKISADSSQEDMLLTSGKKVNMQSGEKIKLF
jgi:type VI secretion system secreted protein VgrG